MNNASGIDTAKTKSARSDSPLLTPHILVVDDDTLICQQLERLYEHSGYQVSVTHFAENALQMPLSMQAKLLLALNDPAGPAAGLQSLDPHRHAGHRRYQCTAENPRERWKNAPRFLLSHQPGADLFDTFAPAAWGHSILVQDFIRHRHLAEKQISNIAPKAMGQLMRYHWPGNVRELQNVLKKSHGLDQRPQH